MATLNELQTYDVGNGTVVTVAWLTDDFAPATPEQATMAKLVFSDGEMAFFTVNREVKALAAFDESQHPRAEDGKFTDGTSSFEHRADKPAYWAQNTKEHQNLAIDQRFQWKGMDVDYIPVTEDLQGSLTVIDKNRGVVAILEFADSSSEEADKIEAVSVEVHPEFRRKGIATMLYDKAEKLTGQKFEPSHMQTKSAKAFWAARRMRSLARREGPLHAAADAHVAKLSVAVRYAFALARRAIRPLLQDVAPGQPGLAQRVAEPAVAALTEALRATLPGTLRAVLVVGGQVGMAELGKRLRVAGGPGSGHFGHAGRPGEVGGSAASDEGGSSTSTPQFKAWFGESKVVEKDGTPLKVYHRGSFNESHEEELLIGDEGMHFGTKDAADSRPIGKGVDDRIKSIELDQDKETGRWHWSMDGIDSYDLNEEGFDDAADARSDAEQQASDMAENDEWDEDDIPLTEAYLKIENPMHAPDQAANWSKTVAKAKALGHDGIIYINKFEDKGSTSYIVFRPTQVKSTKSKGFDLKNPLITASGFDPSQPRDEQGQWTESGSFPRAKSIVDGRTIPDFDDEYGPDVPNMSSIEASLTNYEILDGIREIPIAAFENKGKPSFYSVTEEKRVQKLADAISRNKRITPLIIVVDDSGQGPWVLEGGHRFDALKLIGAKSFPALVVIDKEPTTKSRAASLRTAKRDDRRGPFRMAFDVASPEAIAWADRHAGELIDGITETSREAISNAVAEALEEGDLQALYDEILEAVGSEERAELIAKTEVMTAANEGLRQSWRQAVDNGLLTGDEERTWIATTGGTDESVCDVCKELDGTFADLDGEYPEPGGAGPPAHPRCRCTEGLA